MSTSAWSVSVGVEPRGGRARSNSVVHAPGEATHAATMFASELNEPSVSVWLPFGGVASTAPTAPVAGFARFWTIPAAFCRPLAFPPIFAPSMNRASA